MYIIKITESAGTQCKLYMLNMTITAAIILFFTYISLKLLRLSLFFSLMYEASTHGVRGLSFASFLRATTTHLGLSMCLSHAHDNLHLIKIYTTTHHNRLYLFFPPSHSLLLLLLNVFYMCSSRLDQNRLTHIVCRSLAVNWISN